MARLALAPALITRSEFDRFVSEWVNFRSGTLISEFLSEISRSSCQPETDVESEFLAAIISRYASTLESAANVRVVTDHAEWITSAFLLLELLNATIDAVPTISTSEIEKVWARLFECALRWQHFRSNEMEPALRDKEEAVLQAIARMAPRKLELVDALKPWERRDDPLSERQGRLQNELIQRLWQDLEAPAVTEVIERYVLPPNAIRSAWEKAETGANFLLTSCASPLMREPGASYLREAWVARRGTSYAVADAHTYLDRLLLAVTNRDPSGALPSERVENVKSNPMLFAELWEAATAIPSQYRQLSSDRARRRRLIDAGLPETLAPLPAWMENEEQHDDD